MVKEKDIKERLRKILEALGGFATAQDIINYIRQNFDLTENDRTMSVTRPGEETYEQRVRNIVSHAQKKNGYEEFPQGFAIVHTDVTKNGQKKKEWLFVLPEVKSGPSITEEKDYKGRKIDWDGINQKRREIGEKGERYVYEQERLFVAEHFPSEIDRVVWISREKGDGFGYDVRSVCHENPAIDLMIEVKTTFSKAYTTKFQISLNEARFLNDKSKENEIHEIYRLYNPENDGETFSVVKLASDDIILSPSTYDATIKEEKIQEIKKQHSRRVKKKKSEKPAPADR